MSFTDYYFLYFHVALFIKYHVKQNKHITPSTINFSLHPDTHLIHNHINNNIIIHVYKKDHIVPVFASTQYYYNDLSAPVF